MNIDETAFVREQYATEDRLRARKSAESWDALAPLVTMPQLGEPVRVRRHSTVFVAEKASA